MDEILCFCFGKHGEKKAEKSRKIAQSLPGDDSSDTSAADVLRHYYIFIVVDNRNYFNVPQVYLEFGVKAGLNPFGRRPAKAGAIMIG